MQLVSRYRHKLKRIWKPDHSNFINQMQLKHLPTD